MDNLVQYIEMSHATRYLSPPKIIRLYNPRSLSRIRQLPPSIPQNRIRTRPKRMVRLNPKYGISLFRPKS